jgi:hypothetical protein
MWIGVDGNPASTEDIKTAMRHGPGLVKTIKTRTWATEAEAKSAAAALDPFPDPGAGRPQKPRTAEKRRCRYKYKGRRIR